MADYESLENEVEDLKKQLWYLSTKVVPVLQSKVDEISAGGTTSPDEGGESTTPEEGDTATSTEWEDIFDFDSDDPTLNLNLEAPIKGDLKISYTFPDISQYRFLKVVIQIYSSNIFKRYTQYFDIQGQYGGNYLCFFQPYNKGLSYFVFEMEVKDVVGGTGKTIEFGEFKRVVLSTTKLPTHADHGTIVENGIVKIQGLK